jgi:hypothetical protein
MYTAMKKEKKAQQGKQAKILSDKLNGYTCP